LNDHAPTRSPGLKTASAALGALAVGALAIGAVAIGAVAIGRLVIGRSRIRRLEIDQLVVGSLQVRDSLVTPEMSSSENNAGTTPETHYFKSPTSLDRVINSGFGFLVRLGLGLPHNYLLEVRGRRSGRLYSMPVNVLTRRNKRYRGSPRIHRLGAQCDSRRSRIAQARTAVGGVRHTFGFGRRKARNSKVIPRSLPFHRAEVFPTCRGFSECRLPRMQQSLPGVRAVIGGELNLPLQAITRIGFAKPSSSSKT
jgi:hypothetical protein